MATIADLITRHRDAILERWEAEAQTSASGRGLARPELLNNLGDYLGSLAENARGPAGHAGQMDQDALAAHHSTLRLRRGFDLDEVVAEYAILGRAIARTWADLPAADRPGAAEVQWLVTEITRATEAAVALFTGYLREEAQAEKRYLGLLQRIATAAVDAGPLRDRLPELLTEVVAAVKGEADGFLVYLHDPGSGELVRCASVGLPEAEAEPMRVALAPSAFAAQVAASDWVEYLDGPRDGSELAGVFARGAFQAILGARLWSREVLLGVLYAGLRHRRRLDARSEERLGVLATRLALLLDNARLYDQWRADAERLRAEQASREQFVSTVSHDLRTPLTAALGTTRLLKRALAGGVREAPGELVDLIDRNLTAMTALVHDLLDISKLSSGRQPLARVWVDVSSLIADSLELVAPQARERQVALRTLVPAGLRAHVDRLKLEQVLVNLLANAVAFTPPGGEVVVEGRAEGGRTVLTIRDTGAGIARADVERIFEPFVQAAAGAGPAHANRRQRRARGTGLGLAICRQIVALHGGRIWAESDGLGRGSTFVVVLPQPAPGSEAA
jgi:signal transduction histidine kinase